MQRQDTVRNILKKYNQEHILDCFENLDEFQKSKFEEQIMSINFEEIINLYKNTKIKKDISSSHISPIEFIDKEKIENTESKKYIKMGENIIKKGEFAIITMAGGQGTRLGFNGPKGTFKLKNGKYIFQILAENFKKAEEQYGVLPYWYIMTSEENNKQTIDFLEEHRFFGYDKSKVDFFIQGELPVLTFDRKVYYRK